MADPVSNQRLGNLGDQNINSELDFVHSRLNSLSNTLSSPPASVSVFTRPGLFNWTVPDTVNYIFPSGVAGGGGGGTGTGGGTGGGGGGGGAGIWMFPILVFPGEVLSITLPSGGASATDGGNLIIKRNAKTILSLLGGHKGANSGAGGAARLNSGAGGAGGASSTPGSDGISLDIQGYNFGTAGTGQSNSATDGGGGGGGASIFGIGQGATTSVSYGAGGAGRTGAGNGFTGGNGYLAIVYFS